jgi:hypothetical protein
MNERRRGGATPKVTDDEIRALLDKGLNGAAIARQVGLTPQAISLRLKTIRSVDEERAGLILPWVVKSPEHTQNWIYKAVRAYAKHSQGRGVSSRELDMARDLEEYMRDRGDGVVGYDHKDGFYFRARRSGDDPKSILVKD